MRHKKHEEFVNNMIGRRFNRWTVVRHENREKGYWCRCDCGTEKPVKPYALKNDKSKSCGCLEKEIGRPSIRKADNYSAKREIHKNYRGAAKRRGYDFELDFETFVDLIEGECSYCGSIYSNISSLKAHKDYKFNGIDRVDNNKGYTKENCVTACKICNNSKASLTLEEWDNWIENIYKGRLLGKKLKGEHYGNE